MSSYTEKRKRMVRGQIASRGVADPRVLTAMSLVPRELFVQERMREFAYEDAPLPIEEAQTISQPYIVAIMAEALELGPSDRILEIGAGSGYAAAVLSRIGGEVFAVERHATLAKLAQERASALGYDNLQIRHGDGTLGWAEHQPYDAIAVAAGGPHVPPKLMEQLAIGGRLVIPVGDEPRTQELLRVRREGPSEYRRESLGRVRFVPLIGTQGWSLDGPPPAEPDVAPVRIPQQPQRAVSRLISEACDPLGRIEEVDLAPLLNRVGNARIVLIGEASHGTSEFYRMRAQITKELVIRRGFTVLGIEGDFPDTSVIDRFVRRRAGISLRTPAFSRFPTWMWRNQEMLEFIDWLAEHNRIVESVENEVSVHGLDIYSLYNSIAAVLKYLDRVDPETAAAARVRYGCFSPWEADPATYGRAALTDRMQMCEEEAVTTLQSLLGKRVEYDARDGEEFFDAERNAVVVREAERYYRIMYYGSRDSWNLRDRHMFETLQSVLSHRGDSTKAIVWAHNSHVGDASATEMGTRGEFNIGQLAREAYGEAAYSIGFGTDHGTVAAASNWNEPMRHMSVRPSHVDSYERLCHESDVPRFLLPLRKPKKKAVRDELAPPRLERAIGVIYRPDTELLSHYFQAVLPAQFDEYVWFDETRALRALEAHELAGLPETYPFGL